MTIRSFILAITVFLASLTVRERVAFGLAPKATIVANERALHQRFKFSVIVAAHKENLALNTVSDPEDTVRVRIWRALAAASGEELTLKQLGATVGERRTGELRMHLKHVRKQSETLQNKSKEWKARRGLPSSDAKRNNNLRIRIRRGKKNEMYIKLA